MTVTLLPTSTAPMCSTSTTSTRLPDFYGKYTLKGRLTDGWSLVGLTVLQSGQPFSVVDFSGAVGSLYYSVYDGITNPIVPLNYCGVLSQESADRTLRRFRSQLHACPQSRMLHCSPGHLVQPQVFRGPGGRYLRDRLHHRSAQHLPPGLSKTGGYIAGEDDQPHRTLQPEVHL